MIKAVQSTGADDQDLAPGAKVFDQVGDEISALAQSTLRLQSVLSHVLSDPSGPSPADVFDLQEIDQITQTLENLAQFMHGLSAPQDLHLDTETATKFLTLRELADRLRVAAGDPPHPTPRQKTSGDCDLF